MGKEKITIIIPVYNVEDYLQECIDSVIDQTISEQLKIILVDDGSTDSSKDICLYNEERHSNIHYFYKENGGLSSARNFGLKHCSTEYVMFLDSDDKLTENACEVLLNFAEKTNIPIVMGDLETFPTESPNYLWKKYFGNGNYVINNLEDYPDIIFCPSACNKLFKFDNLKEANFSFPEGMTFEDAYAVLPLLIKNNSIGIVDELIYLYRQRENGTSIMDSIYSKKNNFYNHLMVNQNLYKFINEDSSVPFKNMIYKYIARTYNGFLNVLISSDQSLFDDDEKGNIFDELVPMYQDMPWRIVNQFAKTPILKVVYYALIENNKEYFMNPYYSGNSIRIFDGRFILPLPRKVVDQELVATSFGIWFDYLEFESDKVVLIGEIVSPSFQIKEELENDLVFRFKNSQTHEFTDRQYMPILFRRFDGAPKFNKDTTTQGIKLEIPFGDIDRFKVNHYLTYTIKDSHTNNILSPYALGNGLMRKYKGYVTNGEDKFEFNVSNKKRLMIFKNAHDSLLKRFKNQLGKIVNVKKGKLLIGGKMRLAYFLTNFYLSKKKIVLIGERSDTFQDNSSHLFKYVRENHPKENWYYVIEEGTADYKLAEKYGNVIKKDSFKHYMYLLSAKVLINSYDLESYMIPKSYTKGDYLLKFGDLIKYKRIFLQHGIIYNSVARAVSKYRTGYDMVVTSNELEKDFFVNKANYPESDMIKSGLPRYDRLKQYKDSNTNSPKKILLMPTWRSWLAPKSYLQKNKRKEINEAAFLQSDYYKFYNEILKNEELMLFLEENNIELNFYPHYEMKVFLHLFNTSNDRVKIAENKDVQDLLIEHDLLITDYSSVFFDFLFMNKPVVFTQFDFEEFFAKQYQEGYINFKDQKAGPVVDNVDDLIKVLKLYNQNNFILDEKTKENVSAFFDYNQEGSNSEFIYKTIKDRFLS